MKEQPAQEFDILFGPQFGQKHYWRDCWQYRGLLYFLAWRDILVRYKQAVLGIAWSVLRPLLTIAVFSLVFGRLAKLPSPGVPYPLLVFAAMLPWQFFAGALVDSSNSLLGSTHLISKVFFPRLIIPVSSVMVHLLDFLISLALLLGLAAWYKCLPDARVLFLPLFLLLALLLVMGCGFWFSALNVKYRDFRYIVPFIVQLGLYVSPVGFSSAVIPGRWRLLYALNPLAGIIDGFRWSLLRGQAAIYWPGLWLSLLLVGLVFFSGLAYFRRTERHFADVI